MAPKYGDFPVFQYQTFDSDSVTFKDPPPVVSVEDIQFTDRSADELTKPEDPDPEPEIIELDGPGDDAADDAPEGDGMTHPFCYDVNTIVF